MKIFFDLKNDSISLSIHNKTFNKRNTILPDKYYPIIVFGKSDHIIDVPSFAIKDLSIGNKKKYFFPLQESEGSKVHDIDGKITGIVSNPEWLINDAYHWKHKTSFHSETVAGSNFNPLKEEIYFYNSDSIVVYNAKSGELKTKIFSQKCPVKLSLGSNFLDTKNNKLYSYELYYDSLYKGPTVASLDLSTYLWKTESFDLLPVQLHHHAAYFDQKLKQYTIFGGFGNMHYSNSFYSYPLNEKEWQKLKKNEGENIFPRYFSSMGYLKKTNSLYIFGGMGNESGEQIVGREYFYDLYKVDLNSKKITKLWEIDWHKDNVVPVRGMVILDDSCFYTLCYPEHFTSSFLKLYRFSLSDGSYEILGDSIPIYSDKISTNANLYYSSNHLYAVIEESRDDISSTLKIYSLVFPPVAEAELHSLSKRHDKNLFTLILLPLLTIIGIGFLFYWKNQKAKNKQKPEIILDQKKQFNIAKIDPNPNSVYLFGDFTVIDRNNRDITYMFSTRLKQVFCILLQHSIDGGLPSQQLSEKLWPGKPASKVKNSRGVTINHLRKVLKELDGIELIYDQGCFKLIQSDNFYCDFIHCMNIIHPGKVEQHREELIKILGRGKFLKLTDHQLFDSFKEEVEQKLEPILLLQMEKSFMEESYQTALAFAEAVFNIDPLNDTALKLQIKALQKLKRFQEAKLRYQAFAIEYKKIMGKECDLSFKGLS
ncbi:Kelch repeat-containing protein [Thermophagus sp. OGC60D27]|uniref:Kelch repeat-containing protein n=1 Tax=Thermophagus sp. OGC60D27 TaxID=3458415 RepID=UPI004037C29D